MNLFKLNIEAIQNRFGEMQINASSAEAARAIARFITNHPRIDQFISWVQPQVPTGSYSLKTTTDMGSMGQSVDRFHVSGAVDVQKGDHVLFTKLDGKMMDFSVEGWGQVLGHAGNQERVLIVSMVNSSGVRSQHGILESHFARLSLPAVVTLGDRDYWLQTGNCPKCRTVKHAIQPSAGGGFICSTCNWKNTDLK